MRIQIFAFRIMLEWKPIENILHLKWFNVCMPNDWHSQKQKCNNAMQCNTVPRIESKQFFENGKRLLRDNCHLATYDFASEARIEKMVK